MKTASGEQKLDNWKTGKHLTLETCPLSSECVPPLLRIGDSGGDVIGHRAILTWDITNGPQCKGLQAGISKLSSALYAFKSSLGTPEKRESSFQHWKGRSFGFCSKSFMVPKLRCLAYSGPQGSHQIPGIEFFKTPMCTSQSFSLTSVCKICCQGSPPPAYGFAI